jgi:dihydropteroate synthase
MGILNVTPDSFSDGGLFLDRNTAIKHAVAMAADGADIIDVGGESTRPGSDPVSPVDELDRVIPVVQAIAQEVDAAISIDTTKAEVAEAALGAGAVIVNDVSAMRFDPTMSEVVASWEAGLVLMHMLGEPRTMQKDPEYDDVVADVTGALTQWADTAADSGISRDRIALDPGIGFGKKLDHNLMLVKSLHRLVATGHPVLVGPSRKSFIGTTLDLDVDERLEGTAAVVALCIFKGAHIVRVHDVKEMTRVVRMAEAIARA